MQKFILVGDTHIRGTNPRNRLDSYTEAWKRKLREVWGLAAADEEVEAVIITGDIFDSPDVANSVLNEAADVLSECPVPIYTTAGNHDIPGYNIQAYKNTSLQLLERLVPQLHVINSPANAVFFGSKTAVLQSEDLIQLTFTPYSGKIDLDGYGYSPEDSYPHPCYKIHVAHGMLLDHEPPFDRFTHIEDVVTEAHMVLTGHDHTGYGVYRRADGVIFCNPGSLTRLSASASEMGRTVQVALITVDLENAKKYGPGRPPADIQLIPLKSAEPGELVLDRSKIEADKKRSYAMETFAALVQTKDGEEALLDINHIVETIAEQEGIEPDVVRIALDKIETARLLSRG